MSLIFLNLFVYKFSPSSSQVEVTGFCHCYRVTSAEDGKSRVHEKMTALFDRFLQKEGITTVNEQWVQTAVSITGMKQHNRFQIQSQKKFITILLL